MMQTLTHFCLLLTEFVLQIVYTCSKLNWKEIIHYGIMPSFCLPMPPLPFNELHAVLKRFSN